MSSRTPGVGPDLGDQLGGRRGVVRAEIEHGVAERFEVLVDPGVPLRPRLLRERAVRDLADDVAAELPRAALEHQQPGRVEHLEVGVVERLTQLGGELGQRQHATFDPEDRGVVEHGPLRRGELVEPSRDQGSERPGQLGGVGAVRALGREPGELGEEQRVAAGTSGDRPQRALGQHAAGGGEREIVRLAPR